MSTNPPPLDDLVGEWMSRTDLTHLHSLRNQWGQAHVNADLTSLSWLAIPPFSGGYHTGVLSVDGAVPSADRLRWAPWGVQREAIRDGLRVLTDTRMAYEANRVLWRVTVTNESNETRSVELRQELLAPVAHSEVDWGWLYGTPWTAGHYHDFYATERIRNEATANSPRQVQLIPHDARLLRLGRPRVPGIQRDEDADAMRLDSALPDHTTADTSRPQAQAIIGTVSDVVLRSPGVQPTRIDRRHRLTSPSSEVRLSAITLVEDSILSFTVLSAEEAQTGVILTHGNHPDSLQVGLEAGRPWLAMGGERVVANSELCEGSRRFAIAVTAEGAELFIDDVSVARTAPWWSGLRWQSGVRDGLVEVVDAESIARAAYGLTPTPESLVAEGSRGVARWSLLLGPGERAEVGFALCLGTDSADVAAAAHASSHSFAAGFAHVADRWRELWNNAFRPDNPDHSGYLPLLDATDRDLGRTYYLGILLALYLRNTGVSGLGPVFLTGGPRLGPTITFYWDLSEWGRTAAMLEPVGQRAWILAALAQPYDSSHSFDTYNLLPVGNHYAANDHSLFRIVQDYVGVTGDLELLDELAAGKSVFEHLRTLAFRPRERRIRSGRAKLVDFGHDAWELLECVPNYRDIVVSFNAGYVGMLRSFAALLERRGESVEADRARREADELATAVLGQYAGDGRWRISHPSGDDVIGHCLDFELVAADMADDLNAETRRQMIEFVTTHLLDGEWMRALSPDDPIAPFSDRPDHGAAGAFAAWPGATSFGLSRLGRPDIAAAFLARVHRSRSGALWGQAVEAIGNGRFTVAEREVSNRDSNAAVAVTEAILAGLFDIRADFQHLDEPLGTTQTRFGVLSGVRAVGFDLGAPEFTRQSVD